MKGMIPIKIPKVKYKVAKKLQQQKRQHGDNPPLWKCLVESEKKRNDKEPPFWGL